MKGMKMAIDKAKKINAFKELVKLAKNRSVKLYMYANDFWGERRGRTFPIEWGGTWELGHLEDEQDYQKALERIWECILDADPAGSVTQMQNEKKLVRLLLEAGANPNYYSRAYGQEIFDLFSRNKAYIALEIAKAEGFKKSKNLTETFKMLADIQNSFKQGKAPYSCNNKEEAQLNAQIRSDYEELISILFQKGMCPGDSKVLEKDPAFLNRNKQSVVSQTGQEKTPLQIYNTLKGRRKEKS